MSEVLLRDVLVRGGGRTLLRYGVPFVCSGGIGRTEEVKETFTRPDATPCALYHDRAGNVQVAAAGIIRPHWPGIVDVAGNPLCGLLLESTRQNKIENGGYEQDLVGTNFNLSAGVRDGTNVRHGSWACKITTTNADSSGCWWATRAGPRIAGVAARTYTVTVDVYAPAAAVGKTFRLNIEWWNAVPAQISATIGASVALVPGWNRFSTTGLSPAATAFVTPTLYANGAPGIIDIWTDLADLREAPYAGMPIPTSTGVVTRADEVLDVPVAIDMLGDFTVYLHALVQHSNVASWADTEPQLDTFGFGLYPTTGTLDNADALRFHRQNSATAYEWEYGPNTPTASRSFTVGTAAQKLILRHYAADHHLDLAIDGSAFVASAAPAPFTVKSQIVMRLSGNAGFAARGPDWTLIDAIVAKGLRTQAEMEVIP